MRSFSNDTDCPRSPLARIASYSFSLLDARKSSRMACSTLSPVGALSYKPTLAPIWREAPSTLIIHQPPLSWSTSSWGNYAKNFVNTCPFNAKRGLYWIPNSLSSIAHRVILPDRSSLSIVFRKGRLVSTMIGRAWK